MSEQHRICERAIALLLTFALLSVSFLMGTTTSRASTNSSLLLVGRLALAGEQSMYVNGNQAGSGTTVFSGMRLQTPAGVDAVVQLGALGHLNMEPNTDLLLDFSTGRVEVKVATGDVTLATNDGVNGALTTADGRMLRSEGAKAAVLMSANGAVPAARRLSGKQKAAIIIPIVAAIVIIAIVVADDDDESPSNP